MPWVRRALAGMRVIHQISHGQGRAVVGTVAGRNSLSSDNSGYPRICYATCLTAPHFCMSDLYSGNREVVIDGSASIDRVPSPDAKAKAHLRPRDPKTSQGVLGMGVYFAPYNSSTVTTKVPLLEEISHEAPRPTQL